MAIMKLNEGRELIMSLCNQPGCTEPLYPQILRPGTAVDHSSAITALSANQTPSDETLNKRKHRGAELLTIRPLSSTI
jgi:hypothetical protein